MVYLICDLNHLLKNYQTQWSTLHDMSDEETMVILVVGMYIMYVWNMLDLDLGTHSHLTCKESELRARNISLWSWCLTYSIFLECPVCQNAQTKPNINTISPKKVSFPPRARRHHHPGKENRITDSQRAYRTTII